MIEKRVADLEQWRAEMVPMFSAIVDKLKAGEIHQQAAIDELQVNGVLIKRTLEATQLIQSFIDGSRRGVALLESLARAVRWVVQNIVVVVLFVAGVGILLYGTAPRWWAAMMDLLRLK